MGTAHSDDLRSRVVAEVLAGASRRQAAERFKVSAASAVRWAQLHSQTGGVCPRSRGGKSRSPLEPHAAWLLDLSAREGDLTLAELERRILEGVGVKTTEVSIRPLTVRLPGRAGTERAERTSYARGLAVSRSGAPKSSSGRVVPRPSDNVVPSSITVPA